MHVARLGTRVPYTNEDPFFQTTPEKIDAAVKAFCRQLGGLKASFTPVVPAPDAETGWCHLNVVEHAERHGGRPAFGWAIWANQFLLMAEFHAIWISPTGEAIDVTPAAEGESHIVFAVDVSYPTDFDFRKRPQNRAMRTIGGVDPATIERAIAALSPAQREYEERRAAHKEIDLATHMAAKAKPSRLAVAIDDLIRASLARDRLVVPTAEGVYSSSPRAFMTAQSKVSALELTVRRLLAEAA